MKGPEATCITSIISTMRMMTKMMRTTKTMMTTKTMIEGRGSNRCCVVCVLICSSDALNVREVYVGVCITQWIRTHTYIHTYA